MASPTEWNCMFVRVLITCVSRQGVLTQINCVVSLFNNLAVTLLLHIIPLGGVHMYNHMML